MVEKDVVQGVQCVPRTVSRGRRVGVSEHVAGGMGVVDEDIRPNNSNFPKK